MDETEATRRSRSDRKPDPREILLRVSTHTTALVGEAFFQELTQRLTDSLSLDIAMVGEIVGDGRSVRTISHIDRGVEKPTIEYVLAGTPCEHVTAGKTCIYEREVSKQFPDDATLRELDIESYVGTPLFNSKGNPIGLIAVLHRQPLTDPGVVASVIDIFAARAAAELERRQVYGQLLETNEQLTEQFWRTEQALKDVELANDRFRDFAEVSSDWLWETNADSIITWLSPAFDRVTGLSRHQVMGRSFKDLKVSAVDPDSLRATMKHVNEHKPFRNLVLVSQAPGGRAAYWSVSGKPNFDQYGNFKGFRGACTNITREIEARREQRQTKAVFEETIENFPGGMVIFDKNLDLQVVNPNYYRLNDLAPERFPLGTNLQAIVREFAARGYYGEGGVDELVKAQIALATKTQQAMGAPPRKLTRRAAADRYLEITPYGLPDGGVAMTYVDVTETTNFERQLMESRDLLQTTFDSFPGGIAIFSPDMILVAVNSQYYELLELNADKFPIGCLYDDMVRDLAERGWYGSGNVQDIIDHRVKQSRQAKRGEYERSLASGRVVEVRVYPLPNGGSVRICLDITKRKEAERAMLNAKNEAEMANRAKSSFLASMSHEIRTPLNGVLGMAHVLLNSSLGREQKEHVGVIIESGETLLKLLNDILDFSKIEAGRLEIEETEFHLGNLLESTMRFWLPRFKEKGIAFNLHAHPGIVDDLIGDPIRIRQVVFNLLANAFKFTQEGRVELTVTQYASGDGTIETWFSVADSGIGIPEDARERIFEKFTQADSSTTRKFGGTGLGLAISKQLVELMGGEIGFESGDRGSTFWFTVSNKSILDAGETPNNASADHRPSRILGGSSPTRILLAEDNAINRRVILAMLDALGAAVDAVENGIEAVEAAGTTAYDLILMDIQMPVMDGLVAIRKIRAADHPARHVPIIAVTANAMTADRDTYLAAGAVDYLAKPVTPEALRAAVMRSLTKLKAAG